MGIASRYVHKKHQEACEHTPVSNYTYVKDMEIDFDNPRRKFFVKCPPWKIPGYAPGFNLPCYILTYPDMIWLLSVWL